MEQEPEAGFDLALAHEVAQREGAAAVVGGEIHEAGGRYLLAVQVFTPGGLEALASARQTAGDPTEIIGAIDKLSLQLRERIGESARSLRAEPPLAQVTTSNLAALRKLSQAREAAGAGDYERQLALLEEAVGLDTTFAMAHRALAIRLGNMGRQPARQRDALSKAFEYRDRLTEYERYSVMADYYRVVTHEPAKAITAWEGRLSLNPEDVGALNNIAVISAVMRDYERAEEFYQRAVQTGTAGRFVYSNLAMAQASLGKFEEARATIAAADDRWPGDSNTGLYAGWVEAAAGDYGAAAARFEAGGAATGLNAVGMAAVSAVTGKLRDAEAYQRTAIDGAEGRGDARTVLRYSTWQAYLDILLRDEPIGGSRKVEAALEHHPLSTLPPLDRPYLDVAAAYATAGHPDRARELMGESFDRGGQPDSAIAVYERYISTPSASRTAATGEAGPTGDRYFLGPILERLAQLYDERGDLESAARYYASFVELWADADDELQPRVRAAQQRLEEILGEQG
jgi:tetratricopeptide (TPR) repeat protein